MPSSFLIGARDLRRRGAQAIRLPPLVFAWHGGRVNANNYISALRKQFFISSSRDMNPYPAVGLDWD